MLRRKHLPHQHAPIPPAKSLAHLNIPPTKPSVALQPLFSTHPAKNFVFHLLAHHAKTLHPKSALDAGCGDLRNLRHFPRDYVGITREAAFYFMGLAREENQDWILNNGPPRAYVTALESDFSAAGSFDLCVCTHTLFYIAEKKPDVIARLVERVNVGGSFIVNDDIDHLPMHLDIVGPQFAALEVIYYGCARTNAFEPNPRKSFALSLEEMNTPNTPEGHSHFYLLATKKKLPASSEIPAEKTRLRDNLFALHAHAAD